MFAKNKLFKNHDWIITIVAIILQLIGTVAIYSTIHKQLDNTFVYKQFVFIIIGLITYFLISLIDFEWFKQPGIITLLYISTLLLLIYVKFFGSTTRGVNRWINLGFFSFQPSEYAKIIVILITASMFAISVNLPSTKSNTRYTYNKFLQFVSSTTQFLTGKFPNIIPYIFNALIISPIILLILIQPALGSAIIVIFVWITVLFITYSNQKQLIFSIIITLLFNTLILELFQFSRNEYHITIEYLTSNITYLKVIGIIATLIGIFIYFRPKILLVLFLSLISLTTIFGGTYIWNNHIKFYQKDRILIYIDGPESDPTRDGYQILQSKTALGAGRITGQGYLQGTQTNKHILTQASTDFIFASIGEQFGFLGNILILSLYLILLLRILYISSTTNSKYGAFVTTGIAILILSHIFINIGMNLGKLPVTGIPLPLLSYGGSSILVIMVSLGIVQSVGRSKRGVDIADDLMLTSRSLII